MKIPGIRPRLIAALLVVLAFATGCDNKPDVQTVAVATLMSHPALDQVIVSMREALSERGYKEGENLRINVKNANGEVNLVPNIVQEVKSSDADVVVAITTPVAQAFSKGVDKPLVFSAVTDPVGAGIVSSMDAATEGVSGVSDAWPYAQQLELARKLAPGAQRMGVLYNPGEAASQHGIEQIRALAPGFGFELVEMVATKTTEVLEAAKQSIDKVDIVYLSSDNTVIQALPAALKVCIDNQKPLIVGDSGTVEKGGLAAVSVGYAGVGRETGRIVAEFLGGEMVVPPVTAQGDEIYLNAATAKRIGLELSPELMASATKVYE